MSDHKLPTIRLTPHGPEVGVQGLGCMGISEFYGDTDETEARKTLEAALDAGVTMFDTADVYGRGANERFLAPFVAAHRNEITLATKFGIVRSEDPRYRGFRGDRAYVRESIEGSLKRLGADHVDLYYMHRRDESVPIEETVGAMAELVKEGKVLHLGLSEVTAAELHAAQAVHPIAAVQSEWSLFSRDVETQVVPAAVELGVGFVPYSPLGRGFIAGRFADASTLGPDDFRRHQERYGGDNARANAELLEPIRIIADARGTSLATIALAWVHSRAEELGLAVVPIPGTRKRERLAENIAAATVALTAEEFERLDVIAEQVVGQRYPAGSRSSQERERY